MTEPIRLAICATHPIQYQVPIFRRLAALPDVAVHVFFASDHSVRGGLDPQFGQPVAWDVPMLDGYAHTFLPNRGSGPGARPFFAYDCPTLHREISRERFDAVMIQGYAARMSWQATAAAHRQRLPVLIRAEFSDRAIGRRGWRRWLRAVILRRFYRRLAAFLVIGSAARDHLVAHGVPASRCFDSPYTVDSERFESQRAFWRPKRAEIRAELGIASDARVALFSGKLIAKKQPLLLAEALGKLAPAERERLHVLVVGTGELQGAFEARARPILGPRLTMAGFVNQSELGKFYAAADALVLPSNIGETWGLVVNETMIFGCVPIVSDRVGCAADLIFPATGWQFPSGDADALAARIADFIARPDADLAAMSEAAHAHIQQFSTERATAGIVAALQAVTRP